MAGVKIGWRKRIEAALSIAAQIERLQETLDKEKEIIGSISCALCGNPASLDHYCFGCQSFICNGCDAPNIGDRPAGSAHPPEAHETFRGEPLAAEPL